MKGLTCLTENKLQIYIKNFFFFFDKMYKRNETIGVTAQEIYLPRTLVSNLYKEILV